MHKTDTHVIGSSRLPSFGMLVDCGCCHYVVIVMVVMLELRLMIKIMPVGVIVSEKSMPSYLLRSSLSEFVFKWIEACLIVHSSIFSMLLSPSIIKKSCS